MRYPRLCLKLRAVSATVAGGVAYTVAMTLTEPGPGLLLPTDQLDSITPPKRQRDGSLDHLASQTSMTHRPHWRSIPHLGASYSEVLNRMYP